MAGKFNSRVDERIFLDYSLNNKAYRVYNKRTLKMDESINIRFDESTGSSTNNGDIILEFVPTNE